MNNALRALDRVLVAAEQRIALLDRCRPLNARSENDRVLSAWRVGRHCAPDFRYARPPDLGDVQQLLESLVSRLSSVGGWEALYGERAYELLLEAEAVVCVGTPTLRGRAARRFSVGRDVDATQARQWAEAWCAPLAPPANGSELVDGEALGLALRVAVGAERLAFRVVADAQLGAAAATGENVIYYHPDWLGRPCDIRRIVLHEVWGHARPRQCAQRSRVGLFRVGTAGSGDDEEGRALLLERRAQLLDAKRRQELASRHLAALWVREGVDFVEAVRGLCGRGVALSTALSVVSRVNRGGGLAREVIYLPALSRVSRALAADPSLEDLLERGRVSIAAARRLRELGDRTDASDSSNVLVDQSKSATTGM